MQTDSKRRGRQHHLRACVCAFPTSHYLNDMSISSYIQYDGEPLLSRAVGHGDLATAAALIKAGADVNARDSVSAALCRQVDSLNACVMSELQCLQVGRTPLFTAAHWGDKDAVQLLLSHGARASAEDEVSSEQTRRLTATPACPVSSLPDLHRLAAPLWTLRRNTQMC
jgi:hypothetical protein